MPDGPARGDMAGWGGRTRKERRSAPMSQGVQLIVFPVTDMARAKALYATLLGAEPYADAPYYVGFKAGEQEIGLDPNGHRQGLTGPIPYWEVQDVKTSLKSLLDAGAEVHQDVQE